jgi:hypothetical protein
MLLDHTSVGCNPVTSVGSNRSIGTASGIGVKIDQNNVHRTEPETSRKSCKYVGRLADHEDPSAANGFGALSPSSSTAMVTTFPPPMVMVASFVPAGGMVYGCTEQAREHLRCMFYDHPNSWFQPQQSWRRDSVVLACK